MMALERIASDACEGIDVLSTRVFFVSTVDTLIMTLRIPT